MAASWWAWQQWSFVSAATNLANGNQNSIYLRTQFDFDIFHAIFAGFLSRSFFFYFVTTSVCGNEFNCNLLWQHKGEINYG